MNLTLFLNPYWARMRARTAEHWLAFAWLLVVCLLGCAWMDDQPFVLNNRFWAVQKLTRSSPFEVPAHEIVLAQVGDDIHYYRNISVLKVAATALRKMCPMAPAVIALDFDLRQWWPPSVTPDSATRADAHDLREAIHATAGQCPIVLPVSIGANGFQMTVLGDLTGQLPPGVSAGFINLPANLQYLPLFRLESASGRVLPSFAVAIARAKLGNDAQWPKLLLPDSSGMTDRAPMVTFLNRDSLATVNVADLLTAKPSPEVRAKVHGHTVILGGSWHDLTSDSGIQSDEYPTPAGTQLGMATHANYVAMLLANRVYPQPSWKWAIELLMMLPLGVVFAVTDRDRARIVAILIAVLLYLGVDYALVIAFGLVIDPVLPIAFIVFEAAIEQIADWYSIVHRKPHLQLGG